MIDLRDWTADELRLAARMARDMAYRSEAAGLTRIAALWRHILTRLAQHHAQHHTTAVTDQPADQHKHNSTVDQST
jgi:hypothetical protein